MEPEKRRRRKSAEKPTRARRMKIALIPELTEAAIRTQKATRQTRNFIRETIAECLFDTQVLLAKSLLNYTINRMVDEIHQRETAQAGPTKAAPPLPPASPILFADEAAYPALTEEPTKEETQ